MLHFVFESTHIIIGDQCIIQTSALIEHDCVMDKDNGVNIDPRAPLCGRIVGENIWVGNNFIIRERIKKMGKFNYRGSSSCLKGRTR